MATDDYKHDGQVTITLAYDADEISVWPSVEVAGGVTIALLDSQEPRTNVGIASPDEWDAFVAAGNAALGRPAPASTPLEERIANAATDALAGFGKDTDKDDWTWANGCEAGLRAALAMVREQGATVPRAGVAAVRERCDKWIREEGGKQNEYVEGMTVGIKDAILALDALLAAPTTPTEKG